MAQTKLESNLDLDKKKNSSLKAWLQGFIRPFSQILTYMPSGLYARSLIIIIAPMVLLQSVIAFVFMERHWERVTQHLSRAVIQDIAAVIDIIETYPPDENEEFPYERIAQIAQERLNLTIFVLPPEPLPAPAPKPFFSILDAALSQEIIRQINRPFWIDTIGNSNFVEIRIQLQQAVLRTVARRSHTYASNSHIFLIWMVGSSFVLLAIAILFLRNQITPILRLSQEMESFGKGQGISSSFHLRGAREVRQATRQFIIMSKRIERQIEQRTTMLAGISHDLRTILTRFKLQLALLSQNTDISNLESDVDDMQTMLNGYIDFVQGHGDEVAIPSKLEDFFTKYSKEAELKNCQFTLQLEANLVANLRPNAFQRLLDNLVSNGFRHASCVHVSARADDDYLWVYVDDDGPGIDKSMRKDVFKPFFRLDSARNLDTTGTGLGLSIARDIARTHGGDITMLDSKLGGLRVELKLPI